MHLKQLTRSSLLFTSEFHEWNFFLYLKMQKWLLYRSWKKNLVIILVHKVILGYTENFVEWEKKPNTPPLLVNNELNILPANALHSICPLTLNHLTEDNLSSFNIFSSYFQLMKNLDPGKSNGHDEISVKKCMCYVTPQYANCLLYSLRTDLTFSWCLEKK